MPTQGIVHLSFCVANHQMHESQIAAPHRPQALKEEVRHPADSTCLLLPSLLGIPARLEPLFAAVLKRFGR